MAALSLTNRYMMTTYLCCIAIAVSLLVNSMAVASENLFKNPGFEDGLKYWGTHEWSGDKGKINFTADKKEPHSGESCAKIEWVSGGDNILITQRIPLVGTKSLMFAFWAKSAIQAGTNDRVQTTVEFFNKAGKRIGDGLHKIFTTSDVYQAFSWSFTTPPEMVALNMHLRCRQTVTYFDDVKLIESNGVYLRESSLWIPADELILDVFNNLKGNETTTLNIELKDDTQKLFTDAKRQVKALDMAVFSFPVTGILPGTYTLKIYPEDAPGNAIQANIIWPERNPKWPDPYAKLKIKNNFVTELFEGKSIKITPDTPFKFANPREGWVFFSITASTSGVLELPGRAKVSLNLEPGKVLESMQYLPSGTSAITVKGKVELTALTVSTMPEVIASEYESDDIRRAAFPGLMESSAMREFLHNSNVIAERFGNSTVMAHEIISPIHRERIDAWRATGRKTIVTALRPDPKNTVAFEDTEKYWLSRVGLTEFDGLAIDEFAREAEEMVPFYDKAVKTINSKYPNKTLYAYAGAGWYAKTSTAGFRKTLAAGNHAFAPELYLREQRDEGTAKSHIHNMFDNLRQWERAFPGSMRNIVWTYGSSDDYYASYVLDTFANVNHKYYLDLQFCLMANDPMFFGIRGVCPWIIRYAKPDTLAWQAKLIRHYCIEGKRTMLSVKYGYRYDAEHLKNPDFFQGLAGWTAISAAPGSISAKNIPGYGVGRGTRNTSPDGDDVILMNRVPGKINSISQTIANLKPGSDYEICLRSADYSDVLAGKNPLKVMPLKITLKNAVIDKARSIIHVYPVRQKFGTKFKDGNGICGNHYRVVFRATGHVAELIISDDVPDIAVGQFHNLSFAPADLNQQDVLFNFVQVQELLPQQ